jgi:hypothetical protein
MLTQLAGRRTLRMQADCLLTFKQTNRHGSPHCAVESLQTFSADILVTVRGDDETLQHFITLCLYVYLLFLQLLHKTKRLQGIKQLSSPFAEDAQHLRKQH